MNDRLISPTARASARKRANTGAETNTETTADSGRDGLTYAEALALPVTVDVTTAARALGLGRSTAYELARRNEFPCRVLRIGSTYRIPTADLLRTLGIEPPAQRSPTENPAPSAHSRRLPTWERS
jgi:excisionase family DNA binding protein